MKTLQQIWDDLNAKGMGSDKGSVHSYLPVYEELFKPYRGKGSLLEIGVFKGDSLRMWAEYFGKENVAGIDCSETPIDGMADLREMIKDGWPIFIMDAENPDIETGEYRPRFNIIIDDAGHEVNQQLNLHRIWSKYVRPGGLYIIEDIQNIDRDRHLFEPLGEIIDLRHVKGRYDDVLCICRM
jgi:hypothetical protein